MSYIIRCPKCDHPIGNGHSTPEGPATVYLTDVKFEPPQGQAATPKQEEQPHA